jgi:hypothetical protein
MRHAEDLFRPARLEVEKRPIRVTKIEVVKSMLEAEPEAGLTFPGTVTVFVAPKRSGALDAVRSAATQGGEHVKALRERLKKQCFRRKEAMSPEEFAKRLVREPVFADIRYGGTALTSGVFVPKGLDLVFMIFPYNGGRLAPDGLSLAEHFSVGSSAALEALAVRNEPPLTEAEKVALRSVPPDQLSRNLAVFDDCHTTWWAVAFFFGPLVVAGALTLAATCAAALARDNHINEREIRKLGPAASARALLTMRRKSLERALAGKGI